MHPDMVGEEQVLATNRCSQARCTGHGAAAATGSGALGTYLLVIQIDICDGRVYLQRLGQGLEAATDQGFQSEQKAA